MYRLASASAFAFVLLGVGAASAQTATQDINITATVTKACTIDNSATGTAGSATIPVSLAGAVDTTAITPTGSPFANVACNAPSNLRLTTVSGGVTKAGAPASGFTNVIEYQASATWNSVTATLNTTGLGANGSGTAQAVATANSGNLTVSITPTANTLPLEMGAYSDTLQVTLTPQ